MFVDGREAGFEGGFLEAEHEGHDAEGEDVNLGADGHVGVEVELLRRTVERGGCLLYVLLDLYPLLRSDVNDLSESHPYPFFAAAKIAHLKLSFLLHEHILHLHIPKRDSFLVQKLQHVTHCQ